MDNAPVSPPPAIARYFGRGYYQLYKHFLLPAEQTQAEADFLLRTLRPRPGQRWLDMPCGYGRHLLALKAGRPGLRLVGGDLNAVYLREPGLTRAAEVAACDMRHLPFAPASFHVVLNLLNSFGYYPEADRTILAEFARVLRPGGRLVLDLPNRRALVGLVKRQPLIRYCGGEYEVVEEFEWDRAAELLRNRTVWRWPGGQERAGYALRLYTPRQIEALLGGAGFQITDLFGDFRGGPFDPYESDRLLLVTRRAR